MQQPNKKQTQAIKGLYGSAPGFFREFLSYLEDARTHERAALEVCEEKFNEIQKGKCQILTEEINILKSLVPKDGD